MHGVYLNAVFNFPLSQKYIDIIHTHRHTHNVDIYFHYLVSETTRLIHS